MSDPHLPFPEQHLVPIGNSAPDAPSLDHGSVSVDIYPPDSASQRRLFANSLPLRSLLVQAVSFTQLPEARVKAFLECARTTWVDYSPSAKRFFVKSNSCNLRFCPRCGQRWSQDLSRRIQGAFKSSEKHALKFVTLTLRSSSAPLREQLKFLRASFRRLRQSVVWHRNLSKGMGVIEVTYNAETAQWHPHLHVIVFGRFVQQRALSDAWYKATGGSNIVDVREASSSAQVGEYLSKYLGKPPRLDACPNPARVAAEWIDACRNAKLVIPIGGLKIKDLPEVKRDKEELPADAVSVGSLDEVIRRAEKGDGYAQWILEALDNGGGVTRPCPAQRASWSIYDDSRGPPGA